MVINVIDNDIDNGCAGMGDKCPIALAMQRNGCMYPSVGHRIAHYYDNTGKQIKGKLPSKARDFMWKFDAGGQVSPFSFVLEPI